MPDVVELAQAPAVQLPVEHDQGGPHVPSGPQVWTLLPEEHLVVPLEQTPQPPAPLQNGKLTGHAPVPPHWPFALQVCTPASEHWTAPSVQPFEPSLAPSALVASAAEPSSVATCTTVPSVGAPSALESVESGARSPEPVSLRDGGPRGVDGEQGRFFGDGTATKKNEGGHGRSAGAALHAPASPSTLGHVTAGLSACPCS